MLVLIVVSFAIGCVRSDRDATGFKFTNQTDQTLSIVYVAPDGTEQKEPIVLEILPGKSIVTNDNFRVDFCVAGALIARDMAGRVVAQRDEPICRPGEWVIVSTSPLS